MKKLLFTSAVLAMAGTVMTPVAASAAPIAFSSIPSAQQTAMQNTCSSALNGNSNFVATPADLDASVTTGVETSRVTVQNIPGGTVLGQTPFTLEAASEHRNGSSPNIFGFFNSTVTYSGGLLVQDVTTVDRYNVTFGCLVTKPNGEVAPRGRQIPNDGTLFVNYDLNAATTQDTVSAPDYTEVVSDERVICISPTKNPGTWRQQNGYTGTCSTAVYLSLGGATRSNSVPGLTPLRPNAPDHSTPPALDSLDAAPIAWDEDELAI